MTTPADHRPDPDAAIDVARVTKLYRRWPWSAGTPALRGVALRVHRGEIFGLLGPNGAGKSTLVKILMTVIRASGGQGSMLGRPVGSKRALLSVGYLPEHHRFPDYLTARQVLGHFGALAGVERRTRRARSADLLDRVGLSAWADRKVREFSKGMRQRLGIAQALVNDPALMLLDEPTDGVDPVGRKEIREMLQAERARGRTVFLNSHLLSELEMVCDRVAIMVQGRVTRQGSIDELTAYGQRYELEADADVDWARLLDLHATEPALRDGTRVQPAGRVLKLNTIEPARVQPALDALRAAGVTVRALRVIRPTLEDLFMREVTAPDGSTLPPGAASPADGARA